MQSIDKYITVKSPQITSTSLILLCLCYRKYSRIRVLRESEKWHENGHALVCGVACDSSLSVSFKPAQCNASVEIRVASLLACTAAEVRREQAENEALDATNRLRVAQEQLAEW